MQELSEELAATVKASGGLNGSFWEILNISFLKLHDYRKNKMNSCTRVDWGLANKFHIGGNMVSFFYFSALGSPLSHP